MSITGLCPDHGDYSPAPGVVGCPVCGKYVMSDGVTVVDTRADAAAALQERRASMAELKQQISYDFHHHGIRPTTWQEMCAPSKRKLTEVRIRMEPYEVLVHIWDEVGTWEHKIG